VQLYFFNFIYLILFILYQYNCPGFLQPVHRRVSLVEKKLLTLPGSMSLQWGSCCSISIFCADHYFSFCSFSFVHLLPVFLRFAVSGYHLGIIIYFLKSVSHVQRQ